MASQQAQFGVLQPWQIYSSGRFFEPYSDGGGRRPADWKCRIHNVLRRRHPTIARHSSCITAHLTNFHRLTPSALLFQTTHPHRNRQIFTMPTAVLPWTSSLTCASAPRLKRSRLRPSRRPSSLPWTPQSSCFSCSSILNGTRT